MYSYIPLTINYGKSKYDIYREKKLFINDDNEKKNPSIKIEVERKTPLYRIHLIPINNK